MSVFNTRLRALCAVCLGMGAFSGTAAGQPGVRVAEEAGVAAGEAEAYLRILQVAGLAPAHLVGVRPFSVREVRGMVPDSGHPWAPGALASQRRVRGGLLRPFARTTYNSGFPYGHNDGVAWSGRGFSGEVRAGAVMQAGPLSVRVEPVAFWAENREFPLMANGRTGSLAYAHGRSPSVIDLPQRFGPGRYVRVDPGETTVRLDVAGLAVGASTAAQQWGPAEDHPLVLGTNAGGFPHAFVGTGAPTGVGVGRVHARVVWGVIEQSRYSIVQGHGSRRYATGMVATFTPRGLDGLELGATRFFHQALPEGGIRGRDLLKVAEGFVKASLDSTGVGSDGRSSADNQLASVFMRLSLPAAGAEVFGEFAREDHSWDLLDLTLEPDHASGYTLGFRKVWVFGARRLVSLRGEVVNTQRSQLARVRGQDPFYTHYRTRQGHTSRGQVLGSVFANGGGGSLVALDVYHRAGRWSLGWSRGRISERSTYLQTGRVDERAFDVMHSLSADALISAGRLEVGWGVNATANLNRYHAADAYNLNAELRIRVTP